MFTSAVVLFQDEAVNEIPDSFGVVIVVVFFVLFFRRERDILNSCGKGIRQKIYEICEKMNVR